MKESEHSAMKVLESHYQVTKAYQLGHANEKTLQAGGCLMKDSDCCTGLSVTPRKYSTSQVVHKLIFLDHFSSRKREKSRFSDILNHARLQTSQPDSQNPR